MIKVSLIILTLVSVTVDTMLLPYYPMFFSEAFGAEKSWVTGAYLASSCVTVMLCLPIWAKVAKHIHELDLWIVTQIIAAILGICCYFVKDLWLFWGLSQLMLAFKASYLLIYPFVLRLESRDQHLGIIGLFSVLMHIGGIGGAFIGGLWLSAFTAQAAYLLMASADILQVFVCILLKTRIDTKDKAAKDTEKKPDSLPLLLKLCLVSVFVYFSAFLIRPFFTAHWQAVADISHAGLTALIYAIPAVGALAILWLEHVKKQQLSNVLLLISAVGLSVFAVLFQGQPHEASVIFGRLLYAWSLYQMTVRLELILFEATPREDFGEHFAKLHLSQNIGLIGASFASAYLVDQYGLSAPFYLSALGFTAAFLAVQLLFREKRPDTKSKEALS